MVPATSPDKINFTTHFIYDVLEGSTPLDKILAPGFFPGFVDIRDVARLVVFAIDQPEKASGERFLLASAYSPLQAVADIIRDKYPQFRDRVQEGTLGEGYTKGFTFPEAQRYDGSKATRVTGQDYIPWQKTITDSVEAFKGLLPNLN